VLKPCKALGYRLMLDVPAAFNKVHLGPWCPVAQRQARSAVVTLDPKAALQANTRQPGPSGQDADW